MTALRVVTWNAEGMFVPGSKTRRATQHDAVKVIKRLNADIVFIPEFGDISSVDETIITALHALGYQTIIYSYDQEKHGTYGAALLSRMPVRSHTVHHFHTTGRAFIEAVIELKAGRQLLRVIGLHLDDESEQLRVAQIEQLLPLLAAPHVGATIVLGDFNAMTARSITAKLFGARPAGRLGTMLPGAQLQSMSRRVHQMARGTTIDRLLEESELHDLDPAHHLTISAKQAGLEWVPKLRLAKIDWIFATQDITTRHYRVWRDVGSDHRPVIADLIVRK